MKKHTLREIFANVNGASFIGLDTESVVSLKGGMKNEFKGRLTKRTNGASVMVFTNKEQNGYENMVHRRLVAEGKDPAAFSVGPRKWGTRVEGLPIIEHEKDGVKSEYLEVIFLRPGKTEYFLDGKPVDPTTVEGFEGKDESKEPTKHELEGQGGLENNVIVRTFKDESIVNIRIDGVEYQFR